MIVQKSWYCDLSSMKYVDIGLHVFSIGLFIEIKDPILRGCGCSKTQKSWLGEFKKIVIHMDFETTIKLFVLTYDVGRGAWKDA
jgi:hypothetical protein